MPSVSKKVWFLLIAAILFASLVMLFLRPKSKDETSGAGALRLAFHPDAVVKFEWHSEGLQREFSRKSRDVPWTPTVHPQRMQDRLNLLAELQLKEVSIPSKGPTRLVITFSDQQMWDGIFDGKQFVWTSGQFEGKGALLSERQKALFLEGAFAFENHGWDWCLDRVTMIQWEDHWTMKQIGLEWRMFSSGERVSEDSAATGGRAIDPNFVEKWFSSYCHADAEAFLDYKFFKKQSGGDKLIIRFQKAKPLELEVFDDGFFQAPNKGVLSQEFARALTELTQAPNLK